MSDVETALDMQDYRRLMPDQRAHVDAWLDRCGIHRASRIKRLADGSACVLVRLMNDEGQWYGEWLPVSDPPFPWDQVLQRSPVDNR